MAACGRLTSSRRPACHPDHNRGGPGGLIRRRKDQPQPADRIEWVTATARRILAERGIETTIQHGDQPEDVTLVHPAPRSTRSSTRSRRRTVSPRSRRRRSRPNTSATCSTPSRRPPPSSSQPMSFASGCERASSRAAPPRHWSHVPLRSRPGPGLSSTMISRNSPSPELADRRILPTPLRIEILEPFTGCRLRRRGIDRAQILAHLLPVTRREPERVADQVDDAGLNRRQRPRRVDRLGQALQPVADFRCRRPRRHGS